MLNHQRGDSKPALDDRIMPAKTPRNKKERSLKMAPFTQKTCQEKISQISNYFMEKFRKKLGEWLQNKNPVSGIINVWWLGVLIRYLHIEPCDVKQTSN
jgi:hypothetical protein